MVLKASPGLFRSSLTPWIKSAEKDYTQSRELEGAKNEIERHRENEKQMEKSKRADSSIPRGAQEFTPTENICIPPKGVVYI